MQYPYLITSVSLVPERGKETRNLLNIKKEKVRYENMAEFKWRTEMVFTISFPLIINI